MRLRKQLCGEIIGFMIAIRPAHIRDIIKYDIPRILQIEGASFESGWSEEDFKYYVNLNNKGYMCKAAQIDDKIVGFMISEMHKDRWKILKLAVDPEYRYRGIGTQLIRDVIKKIHSHKRSSICLDVRESNIDAQRFFKKVFNDNQVLDGKDLVYTGKVIANSFEDTGESAYQLRYALPDPDQAVADKIAKHMRRGGRENER